MSNFKAEINSFQNLWKGGYRTGHDMKRNQIGVENYIKINMNGECCLEIGCGGGQWSKYIYDLNIFKKIYCIDVLSAEHNNFWNYVGVDKKDKIEYIQIVDFSLEFIPKNSLDYVFSYDVFCHISYSGQQEYLKNLYDKCKVNCKLFIMYADPHKYFNSEPHNIHFLRDIFRNKGISFNNDEELKKLLIDDCDSEPVPGRWYWIGVKNFHKLCKTYNYKIISDDLNIDKTNPITLFSK